MFREQHGLALRIDVVDDHDVAEQLNSPLRLARSVMRISIRMSRAVFTAAPGIAKARCIVRSEPCAWFPAGRPATS
jgi:hypothetical protein